jgi:hypothetical protein
VLFYTSSFEIRAANRAIALLVAVLFFYCTGLEIVTRLGLSRISRIQDRIHQDLRVAISIKPQLVNEPPSILLVGNSLLVAGVDRVSLKEDLAPNYHAELLPIENTQFEDWYFGLRRLFAEGSRPSVVVVCLSTRQMMSRATDGEYFAYYMMQARDLFRVKKESQLDNTETSAYFFANHSEWLGSRSQIRNWLVHMIMPNLEPLVGYFLVKAPPMPPEEQVVASVLQHLRILERLCRSNGARLVAVIPPTLGHDDASTDIQEFAGLEGIQVLVPLRPGELTANEFGDGFHLNPHGASRFTPLLASALRRALNTNSCAFSRKSSYSREHPTNLDSQGLVF